MHPRNLALCCTLLALLVAAVGPARGDEDVASHARHAQKIVLLDAERIVPSDTMMAEGDVIVFQNQSTEPIVVTFVDPKDVASKIHCSLVRKSEEEHPRAPWLLFQKAGDQVTATIPPGRFASMCSLSPGKYAFTAKRTRVKTSDAGGVLPDKGQITVQ
jgi:hypothetical protein